MRLVTGRTNRPTLQKKVSIRLSGGHSFSVPEGIDAATIEEVEWLTEHTVLVPKELFSPDKAASYFAASGITIPEQSVVWSDEHEPYVAVMAIANDERNAFPALQRHTSPLLHIPTVLQPTVWICDAGTLIYIKVYDPALQFAEVVPVSGEADRSYLISRLLQRIDAERFVLMLDDRDKQINFYKRHFKTVICE